MWLFSAISRFSLSLYLSLILSLLGAVRTLLKKHKKERTLLRNRVDERDRTEEDIVGRDIDKRALVLE